MFSVSSKKQGILKLLRKYLVLTVFHLLILHLEYLFSLTVLFNCKETWWDDSFLEVFFKFKEYQHKKLLLAASGNSKKNYWNQYQSEKSHTGRMLIWTQSSQCKYKCCKETERHNREKVMQTQTEVIPAGDA